MDRNGRLFGKVSVVDIFVFLLIAAIAAGVVFRFGFSGAVARNDNLNIVYTVKITMVGDFTLEHYVVGTSVYERFSNNRIGEIVAVRDEPYFENHVTNDGRIVNVERYGTRIVYVDIATRGFSTERSYFTEESFELRVGGEVSLWFRYVNVLGHVINIDILE